MTNAEHLIENALVTLSEGKDFEYYISYDYNVTMAKQLNIKLEYIWQMANYVLYTWEDK